MNRIILDKLPKLVQLCEMYQVESLYLFGSAAKNEMRPDSDIDILVTFGNVALFNYFDNFISFKIALEQLFSRSVDLLEDKTVRNPVLRRTIDSSKQLIYGRAS